MKGLVAFARERLGVDFYPGQRSLLEAWAASGHRKAVLALGRRSGKGLMAATAAIYNATVEDYSEHLRPGEARFIVVVATRQEQAREFVRVVRELLKEAPDVRLKALVDEDASTQDEVVFTTGAVLRAMPCSSRSTRGLPISLLVLDEAAHMSTTEDGFAAGKRVYQALLPSTAQFGSRGYVMLTSSPLWASGIFWDLYQAGESGAVEDTFTVRRPTWEMNPRITRESLEAEFKADPDSARVEYGAEFAEGAGAFLQAVNVRECVVKGRKMLPALPRQYRYSAAIDPAFAAGGDAFTLAICHGVFSDGIRATTPAPSASVVAEARRLIVQDRLISWRGKNSPLNSDAVLDEIAACLKEYRVSEVVSDQYAVIPVADGLRRRGITVKAQPLHAELKADIFGALKRAINTEAIELLDDEATLAELLNLEIRPTPSGKPRIQALRGHDDRAMSLATAVHAIKYEPVAVGSYIDDNDRIVVMRSDIPEPEPDPMWSDDPAIWRPVGRL